MATPDAEIIVEDPTAPADDSPPVVATRTVDIITSLLLLALAALFCFDNWRTGIAWEADGPQPGYFPFYLGVILAVASLYGLVTADAHRSRAHIPHAGPVAPRPASLRSHAAVLPVDAVARALRRKFSPHRRLYEPFPPLPSRRIPAPPVSPLTFH